MRLRTSVAVAVVATVVVGYLAISEPPAVNAVTGGVPAHLEYEIRYIEYEGSKDLTRANFVLRMDSWTQWRHEQTCCGPETGYIQEWRPDGTMWSGYESWETGLLLTHNGRPGSTAVPGPDFSNGRPMTQAEIEKLNGAVQEPEAVVEWSARLGLPEEDIFAYRVDGYVSVDGRLTGESTSSHYVFHSSARLPLHHREYQDGVLVREFTVTHLDLDPRKVGDD